MKFFLFSICSLFVGITLNAQDKHINFENLTWAEAKAKASKEKKAVFLDAFTSWCGPCKKLAREVFTNNEVADYFNANFINISMDMEKGEGPVLTKEYNIHAYPTLLFVNEEGKVVNKKIGAIPTKDFLDFGKASVSGESLEYLMAQYKKGNVDPIFMKKFMTRMEGLKENTTAIVEDYFSKVPQEKWKTKEYWYFINRYIRTEESPVFKYVLAHQNDFEKNLTADAVSDYFETVYLNSVQKAANGVFPIEDLKDLKDKIHAMNFKGKGKIELECDAAIADRSEDWKAFIDVMEQRIKKYPAKDLEDQILLEHETCWKLLNKSSDPYVLEKAIKIAENSMNVKIPAYMDTYASLLVEVGNFDKAIEVEEKALAMLKAKPDPDFSVADCESKIEKFKRRRG